MLQWELIGGELPFDLTCANTCSELMGSLCGFWTGRRPPDLQKTREEKSLMTSASSVAVSSSPPSPLNVTLSGAFQGDSALRAFDSLWD